MTRNEVGIVRKMDALGRMVIPMEIRRVLGIADQDSLEFYTNEDFIIIKKYQNKCTFCGEDENLSMYKQKLVCNACIRNVKTARPVY